MEALLDGMMAQTYRHWELVIADAGGAEETVRGWAQRNGAEGARCRVKRKKAAQERKSRKCAGKTCTIVSGVTGKYAVRSTENAGISESNTNRGIEAAAGDYIGLLDHDDMLTPDALYEMPAAAERGREKGNIAETQPLALYSDEDKCDGAGEQFYEPHFKTDFDGELCAAQLTDKEEQ